MPSFRDLRHFCEHDGWELYKKTDHFYYRKVMPDGTIKYTKVSNGSKEIQPHLFKEILNKQLKVSLEYFNNMT